MSPGLEFTAGLFVAAALVSFWAFLRFPNTPPGPLALRIAGAFVCARAAGAIPIGDSSYLALYPPVFLVVLPLLVAAFLNCYWILREAASMMR